MVAPAWSLPYLEDAGKEPAQPSPETILLKDYRPRSIFKIPATDVPRAKFSIIDMHSHAYAKAPQEIREWVRNMDEVGIEKTILLTEAMGRDFTEVQRKFAAYPGRFEIWCGFDYTGYDQSGFGPQAINALERCRQLGAGGVGELHDKGKGLVNEKVKALSNQLQKQTNMNLATVYELSWAADGNAPTAGLLIISGSSTPPTGKS